MSKYLVWIPDEYVKGTMFARSHKGKLVPGLHGGGAKGTSCCWMFSRTDKYKPANGLQRGRILMMMEFVWQVDKFWLGDSSKHIDFENTAFKGESKHPGKIIVKKNEPGAYGVGAGFLEKFSRHIADMDIASHKDYAWAVGQSELGCSDSYSEMKDRYKRLMK